MREDSIARLLFSMRCARLGRAIAWLAAAGVLGALSGCLAGRSQAASPSSIGDPGGGSLPHDVQHVVVVVEENHSFEQIIGNADAPYINRMAADGALFTRAYGVEHPSQPNYLDLFSGSNQGVFSDSCPHRFSGNNLGRQLLDSGHSFAGYSEDLPAVGYTGCTFAMPNGYWRKHNPWVNFANLPPAVNRPLTAFPIDFAALPTVSFVIPNEAHDMHNGTVAEGDAWLEQHIDPYLRWAKANRSLLFVTWDEAAGGARNHIPLIVAGAGVTPGRYDQVVNHFSVLRTIEDIYGLPPIGQAVKVAPITGIWAEAPSE